MTKKLVTDRSRLKQTTAVTTKALPNGEIKKLTRMHSSRMHTVRSSSHLSQGGSASVHAGIPTPRDQAPPRTKPPNHPQDQTPRTRTPPGPGTHLRDQAPPCGQTHACENITFATSLRTVIKQSKITSLGT